MEAGFSCVPVSSGVGELLLFTEISKVRKGVRIPNEVNEIHHNFEFWWNSNLIFQKWPNGRNNALPGKGGKQFSHSALEHALL
jgi:hypothetical protein